MTQPAPPLRRLDRQFYGLQYLRAMAALAVLNVHAFQLERTPFGILGTGVDLFFVLSGFLMVAITDESTRPMAFLRARIRRIVPLYWLITTLTVILLWGGVSWSTPIPFRYLANYIEDAPLGLIAASYAFLPWWNQATQTIQPIVPLGWTLNLEMLFYVLVALALMLPRPRQFPAILAILVALAIAGASNLFDHSSLVAWTNPVILEFLVGAWIGRQWQNGKDLWRSYWVAVAFVLAALSVIMLAGHDEVTKFRFVMAIPYAGLLILVLKAEDSPRPVPRWPVPLYLGGLSYAIYLVQFPVQVALRMLHLEGGPLFAAIMIVSTLAFAAILHRLVEVPMMRSWRQNASDVRPVPR